MSYVPETWVSALIFQGEKKTIQWESITAKSMDYNQQLGFKPWLHFSYSYSLKTSSFSRGPACGFWAPVTMCRHMPTQRSFITAPTYTVPNPCHSHDPHHSDSRDAWWQPTLCIADTRGSLTPSAKNLLTFASGTWYEGQEGLEEQKHLPKEKTNGPTCCIFLSALEPHFSTVKYCCLEAWPIHSLTLWHFLSLVANTLVKLAAVGQHLRASHVITQ